VRTIELTGPEGGSPPQWHETHRRIVTAQPSASMSVKEAATVVLTPLLYRSFRRPVTDAEVARFADLVDQTVSVHKETFEYGMYVAVQAILVSTDFLFRKEADPEGDATERILNEYEVASRLSYFLWSSMPDEELFQLAENKRLFDRTILRGQIERMLKHEKAASLGQNFASQWLNLRNLADVRPNPDVFPDFDDALRSAMGKETILLFNTIVREDHSIDEFLGADYSFVNERLAKHYGIEGVTGEEFVRVSLEGTKRSGVLTHASVLTLTSNPGRTSPVKRGKWILENILGDAPPHLREFRRLMKKLRTSKDSVCESGWNFIAQTRAVLRVIRPWIRWEWGWKILMPWAAGVIRKVKNQLTHPAICPQAKSLLVRRK
jgi:hypothetical protein